MPATTTTTLNTPGFETRVRNTEGVALVDFWADWCPPCKALGPAIDQLAADRDDALVAKVDVDDNKTLARSLGVSSIPTVIVFKDGREFERLVGLRQINEYHRALDEALAG